jgi:hypothetical protein
MKAAELPSSTVREALRRAVAPSRRVVIRNLGF